MSAKREAVALGRRLDAGHEPDGGVLRRGRRLQAGDGAGARIEDLQVREGAADVDGDAHRCRVPGRQHGQSSGILSRMSGSSSRADSGIVGRDSTQAHSACHRVEVAAACMAEHPRPSSAGRPATPRRRTPMAEELPFKKTMIFAYGEPRELAPGVVRIVANNPNHFTFKGTNTYLLGQRLHARPDRSRPGRPGASEGDPRYRRRAQDRPRHHHPHPPRPHRRHAGAAGGDRRQDRRLRPARRQPRHQAHQPLGRRVRGAGFHPRRAPGRRPAARGRRLGDHGAAHARARARSSVLRARGHQDAVLGRPRDGLEHERGGAAGGQHGRFHPLAAAADGAQATSCISPATAARWPSRSAWSRPTCCTGACASRRSWNASAAARTRCAHRAGHLQGPGPQAPQRSVSFCARPR